MAAQIGSIPALLKVRRKGAQTGKRKPRKSGYSSKPTAGSLLSRMSSSGY